MSIKKVWVNKDCIASGLCTKICPEVFRLEDFAEVNEGVNYTEYEPEIQEAAEACPVEAVKYI